MRRALGSLALAAAGLLAAIALVEGALRWTGHEPVRHTSPPGMAGGLHVPDPVLGWRNRPGHHVRPRMDGRPGEIDVTVLPDGSRKTGPSPAPTTAQVAMVGCSFTFGWGIDDSETFAWLLRERLDGVDVRNFATGGYGTYQSLMRVEEIVRTPAAAPRLIVYGFAEFHDARNVAAEKWLKALAFGSGGEARVPYCGFDRDGLLRRHPPIGYRGWPLHDVLATVRLLEDRSVVFAVPVRESQARAVTQALLAEMDAVARGAGAGLVVAMLTMRHDTSKGAYESYAREHGIDLIDCTSPALRSSGMRLVGDLHPNAAMNRVWADCLETHLRARLASAGAVS